MIRILFLIGAVAAILVIANCSVYNPAYVAQVVTRQDATTEDFRWKGAISIPAEKQQRPLPRDASEEAAVQMVFESLLNGEALRDYMTRTGTYSLVAVRSGKIVLERYGLGVKPGEPHAVFSMSKSILSMLTGMALGDGVFSSLDQPITKWAPELSSRDTRFDRITIGHLLNMRSGIAFSQEIGFPWITNDNALVYHAQDLRQVILTQTQIEGPPGKFNYNDYNPNLIGLALERAGGAKKVSQLRNDLWNAIGAEDDAMWSTDSKGFPQWESGLVASPRDLAKIGVALLPRSESLSPIGKAWRDYIFDYTPSKVIEKFDGRTRAYKAGWWLMLRPDGRHDAAAIGRFAQFIYISPANDVVLVRTGRNVNAPSDASVGALFYSVAQQLNAATPKHPPGP